jgi:hypothetical protein
MPDPAIAEVLAEYEELLTLLDVRDVDVYCWRVEQLERAGYSDAVAHLIADSTEIDLHLACSLLARGCSEQTAYAILA